MTLLPIVLIAAAVFLVAYRTYGSLLARLLRLDPEARTPAVELRDDVDYAPIDRKFLLSQHFSAIAAAGPIIGPIQAGLFFGWVPAILWIVLGSIFIGGVHDIGALVASVRHRAKSIAEVVREHMSRRSYLLFLAFIWIALVYIIVAFTDVVARSFVGLQTLEDGSTISGGATATSSLLYLVLPVVMGLLLRFTKLSVGWATVIFLPLVGVAIWAGPQMPFELGGLIHRSDETAVKVWSVLLLAYCLVAGALPVWLLLQPRGHLGGYFLFIALAGAALGIIVSGVTGWATGAPGASAVAYRVAWEWQSEKGALFPMLFITIACGACSGFHSLIASGTTSKQLRRETDAKLVGYGAMLVEGMVSVISLACLMTLTAEAVKGKGPNIIYAMGNAKFLNALGIPTKFAISFALLAFTTFVYDTLDVCARLGRQIIQELTGLHNRLGLWLGTTLTTVVPLAFVTQTMTRGGKVVPAWKVFWDLFGASNQLLAALALIGVTVWLHRTYRARWVWLVAGIPTVLMYVMSTWALLLLVRGGLFDGGWHFKASADPVPWAALVLIVLAVLLLLEAVRLFIGRSGPPAVPEPVLAGAVA